MIENTSKKEVDGLEDSYFNLLPAEMIQKILSYGTPQIFRVCKTFSLITNNLKNQHWNALQTNIDCPADLKNKLLQIENKLGIKKKCKYIGTFFRSLHEPQTVNSFHLGDAMLKAWQADKDYNLKQCWSRIAPNLDLEVPLNNADEIRIWMNHEDNQNRLAQITKLDLSKLKLTNLPSEIVYFKGLIDLNLRHNQLTELPSEITNLTVLGRLDISNNCLTELPSEIKNLTALKGLNLANNRLTKLPSEITNLTALREINLSDNQLTELPSEITTLTALQYLHLSGNQLTKLPSEIKNLTALKGLYFSGNRLTEFPFEITNLTGLEDLNLSDNLLTELPSEITNLTALRHLNLSDNQLTELPSEITNLTALKGLYFSRNQLTKFPSEITNLTALEYLFLSDNQLTELPSEIKNLTVLKNLSLSGNRLTELPNELAEIGKGANHPPEIILKDNILLVIPACVLDKFKDSAEIKNFISLRDAKPESSLDKLCQFIRKNSDAISNKPFKEIETLGKLVDAIDEMDRNKVYDEIWKRLSGKNEDDPKWEQNNRFMDIPIFVSVLGQLLYEKQKK